MAETITMPKLGFDMREGVLVRWVKSEGENISKGDVIAEIETDKATVEVESSVSGIVRRLLANQGDSIPVGSAIALIGSIDEVIVEENLPSEALSASIGNNSVESKADIQKSSVVGTEVLPDLAQDVIKASPLARKFAYDSSVDLSKIKGTGPGGRIVRRDVESILLVRKGEKHTLPSDNIVLAPKSISPGDTNNDRVVQMSKLRQAIGRRLVESKQNIPHFYVSHEYKMDALLTLRKQINQLFTDGTKISVNDFIIKAVALSLTEFPNLNASLVGNEIIQHAAINIGVAVTVPTGLLTIVVTDAVHKSLRQISTEIQHMASRARDGKVKPEDVDGSTFSTSNLGMYDVENFIAIINPPDTAILAIGSSREVPVVEEGQIRIGNRMKCTISVDHRISDGAEAAQFMQTLAKFLEEPIRLMV